MLVQRRVKLVSQLLSILWQDPKDHKIGSSKAGISVPGFHLSAILMSDGDTETKFAGGLCEKQGKFLSDKALKLVNIKMKLLALMKRRLCVGIGSVF